MAPNPKHAGSDPLSGDLEGTTQTTLPGLSGPTTQGCCVNCNGEMKMRTLNANELDYVSGGKGGKDASATGSVSCSRSTTTTKDGTVTTTTTCTATISVTVK